MTDDARPRALDRAPAERLYGRRRGQTLRSRQVLLIETFLPRLRLTEAAARDPASAFAHPVREVWLEVGFGSGEHTAEIVAGNPDVGVIACEVFENGLASLLGRYAAEGEEATAPPPPSLRLWDADARVLLGLLPAASIARLFLMFPDPWPKARHAKRRFVHPGLLEAVTRVLAPGGDWRIASDDPTYQDWVEAVFTVPGPLRIAERFAARPAGWPATRYEAKAVRESRAPRWWVICQAVA